MNDEDKSPQVLEAEAEVLNSLEKLIAAIRSQEGVGSFPSTISGALVLVDYDTLMEDGYGGSGTLIHPMGRRTQMMGLLTEAETRFKLEIFQDYSG